MATSPPTTLPGKSSKYLGWGTRPANAWRNKGKKETQMKQHGSWMSCWSWLQILPVAARHVNSRNFSMSSVRRDASMGADRLLVSLLYCSSTSTCISVALSVFPLTHLRPVSRSRYQWPHRTSPTLIRSEKKMISTDESQWEK